jgi:hypothetical protein
MTPALFDRLRMYSGCGCHNGAYGFLAINNYYKRINPHSLERGLFLVEPPRKVMLTRNYECRRMNDASGLIFLIHPSAFIIHHS